MHSKLNHNVTADSAVTFNKDTAVKNPFLGEEFDEFELVLLFNTITKTLAG